MVRLIYTPSALGPAALGLRVYISGKPLVPMVYLLNIAMYVYIHSSNVLLSNVTIISMGIRDAMPYYDTLGSGTALIHI